ncbi:MAG TPA: hypothetical protein VNY77_09810 [Candidatus Angelobacter sp.]|nr:hypothetical protein [Candidatus Angelobacter sp.]
MVEYPVPNPISPGSGCFGCGLASLGGIAVGGDGNLWFVDSGQYKVGRMTPSGAITEFGLPAIVGGPVGITVGPDGDIWITTNALGQGRQDWIVHLARNGDLVQYPAGKGSGDTSSGPEAITLGPDGNLWFTEFWTNRIGRMTPAGALTEFPIPTSGSGPRGIVAGPDRNLWFVESSRFHPAIARITPAGVVTEFLVGQGPTDITPYSIAVGPDRNLWFTQEQGPARQDSIGRITPAGSVTTFALPAGSVANGLTGGPDGNVWFTDISGNAIGRMSLAGAVHLFQLPRRNAQPNAIVAGPQGRMWFTESASVASIGSTVPEATLSSRVVTFTTGFPTTREVTVSNTGEAELAIGRIKLVGSDQAAFTTTRDDCTGHRLAVQASCRIDVTFTPSADSGVRAARLAITDNATGSPQTVSLAAQLPDCRLPLFTVMSQTTAHGEFLNVRDGTVTNDPNGTFSTDGSLARSQATPVLSGHLPATYSRLAGRWIPAGAISPDGSRYSYVDYLEPGVPRVHVVDVATGRDRVLALPVGFWAVVAFTSDGLYLDQRYEGIGPGLTLVNPDSGAMHTVFTDAAVALISGHVAWIETRDNTDPLPGPGGIGPASNEILRRDLTTSQTTTWLYRSGFGLYVVAASDDSIIVSGNDTSSSYLWLVDGPGQAVSINVPETSDPVPYAQGLIADANGWWIGSLDGLYLWTPHTGAVLVSDSLVAPAGACA